MPNTIGSRRQQAHAGHFVGRIAEQSLFRGALKQLAHLRERYDEQLTKDDLNYPQIFLIAAEGGMGKTTLLRRFEVIVTENADGAGAKAIYVDWQKYSEIDSPIAILQVLHDSLCVAGFDVELKTYRVVYKRWSEIRRKISDAEEKYEDLVKFGTGIPISGKDSSTINKAVSTRQGAIADLDDLREFICQRLEPDEWQLYKEPKILIEAFIGAVNTIATPNNPLVFLLDTYELIDNHDYWFRNIISQSNYRLIWVIAGREGDSFIRRYEEEFGTELLTLILLDTFSRSEIVSFLQQQEIPFLSEELIDKLQTLSRGIPLALEGWANLCRKKIDLPPPEPTAPSTRRAIVRQVTDRFLRYCNEDDSYLTSDQIERRRATRNHVLLLMLLNHIDIAILAAAWKSTISKAERRLNDLAAQFSFVFAQETEYKPHALVKEFVRDYMYNQSRLPADLLDNLENLVFYFESQMRAREQFFIADLSPKKAISIQDRQFLLKEREIHNRNLHFIQLKIAVYSELEAPINLLYRRDALLQTIAVIDSKLSLPTADQFITVVRQPLWRDVIWSDALFELLNVLSWIDRSGERFLQLAIPIVIDAAMFAQNMGIAILAVIEEFKGRFYLNYEQEHPRLFVVLAAIKLVLLQEVTDREQQAIIQDLHLVVENGYLASPQKAFLYLIRSSLLLKIQSDIQEKSYIIAEDADKAISLLSDNNDIIPETTAKLYHIVGQIYSRLKQHEKAYSAYQQAISFNPDSAQFYNSLGLLYREMSQYQTAIAAFQKAITLDPIDGWSHNSIAKVYRTLKQYSMAVTSYKQAISLEPNNFWFYSRLGQLYREMGQYNLAVDAYQHAIEINPSDDHLYDGLGSIYSSLGLHNKAIEAYQKAVEIDSGNADHYNGLGNSLSNIAQYTRAIETYYKAIAIDRELFYPYKNLGNAYVAIGQLENALEAYYQASRIDPSNIQTLIRRAYVERRLGNEKELVTVVDRVRLLLASDAYYDRACIESIAGNVEASIQALQAAIEQGLVTIESVLGDPSFAFIHEDPRYKALIEKNVE